MNGVQVGGWDEWRVGGELRMNGRECGKCDRVMRKRETYLLAKRSGHSLHSYGLSPVCDLTCRPTC